MLVRSDAKQSWSKAVLLPVKDVREETVDMLNEEAGWNKYKLA